MVNPYGIYKIIIPMVQKLSVVFKEDNYSVAERLGKILSDVQNEKSPRIAIENFSDCINYELMQYFNQMDHRQATILLENLIEKIIELFDFNVSVWCDKIIDFSNIESVHVCCEPLLDLIEEKDGGTFKFLQKQLSVVDDITYYLEHEDYILDLAVILENKNLPYNKISYKKIERKPPLPFVLYRERNNNIIGLQGSCFPAVQKEENKYFLINGLPVSWMTFMSKELADREYKKLVKLNQD